IADKALVALYEKSGQAPDVDRARRLQAADDEWTRKVRAESQAANQRLDATDLSGLVRRFGLTNDELRAYERRERLAPATQQKFDSMSRAVDALERPVVDRVLKTMPE